MATEDKDIAIPAPENGEGLSGSSGIQLPTDIQAKLAAAMTADDAATPSDADVAMWLLGARGDIRKESSFASLRNRFKHGLDGVSDTDLERARGVVLGFLRAIRENDAEGVCALSHFFPEFFQVADKQDAIPRACEAMGFLLERLEKNSRSEMVPEERLSADTSDAAWLLHTSLVAIDDGFSKVFAEPLAIEARSFVTRRGDTKNDGRSLKGPRRLLAWAMAKGGAFGATSEATAMKMIEKAYERRTGKKKA